MPMANLPDIMSAFERGGMDRDTPAVLISSSTTPEERVVETSVGMAAKDAVEQGIGSPAIVIVGGIAGMRQQLLAHLVRGP
jgi:uroporphyrin-III C-methyltransferase